MTALPRVKSNLRRRLAWEHFVIGGIERLTNSLMAGDEVGDADFADIEAVIRRLEGLKAAFEARKREAGVLEDK